MTENIRSFSAYSVGWCGNESAHDEIKGRGCCFQSALFHFNRQKRKRMTMTKDDLHNDADGKWKTTSGSTRFQRPPYVNPNTNTN